MTARQPEFLRYGVTIVLGLAVDLGVASAMVAMGAQVELAAVIGVLCGAVFNYFILEHWAFQGEKAGSALARPLRFAGALLVTMAVRGATVWGLDAALPVGTPPIVILGGGVAVSFILNFILSRYWVFRRAEARSMTLGE